MTERKNSNEKAAWEAGTWEGARREQLRRWSLLSLEEIIAAQEEMAELADRLSETRSEDHRGK